MSPIPPQQSGPWYDTPYWYAKNYINNTVWAAGNPPIPLNVPNDVIQSDGDTEFHARRYYIYSGNTGVIAFNLLNQSNLNLYSQPAGFSTTLPGPSIISRTPPVDTPIVPPYVYPRGAGVQYGFKVQDMLTLGLSMGFPDTDGIHTDLVHILPIAFQGVKRWYKRPTYLSPYPYYLKSFTYAYTFNLNWLYLQTPYNGSFNVTPPKTFYIPINDYDFELMRIEASFNVDQQNAGTSASGYMAILYDSDGYQLMNTFIQLPIFISSIGSLIAQGQSTNNWPQPPIVYPANSAIRIDILSLADVTNGGTGPTTINFHGVRRIPCQ